ncbi:DUF7303 family protein, partial [Acinetobacter baumannii]|uniref:DUF7303 family protein n=1 Tax=Acinetobacter baumannii TaxID=470 RepID=UPI001924F02F
DSKELKVLIATGLVEVNSEITDGVGHIGARSTAQGAAYLTQPKENIEMDAPQTAQTLAPAASKFVIANVAIPTPKRGGGRKAGTQYPFDELEIGQSFFVPATEAKPEPVKSLASTVTSANERYSEEIPGQTRINKKGREVPAKRQLRQFVVRSIEDGAPWNHPGVRGAAVFRVEVTDAE